METIKFLIVFQDLDILLKDNCSNEINLGMLQTIPSS